jgi:hypothetical protein
MHEFVGAGMTAVRARNRMGQTMQFLRKVETDAGMQEEQQSAPVAVADPVGIEDYDE